MWTFLNKIHIIFQNFTKNVINDLYKLCFQNYCASLSSYEKEQLKLHQSLLGVKGAVAKTSPLNSPLSNI